jgi:hypothetical protein
MALKAYKHLTDGEVKIVNEGSAEETSLLADTVTGSSYLQLTSTGHAQEVAAAQGTALWVDVTSDLGGGLPTGMDYQVFEVTNLAIPSGTNWKTVMHKLGDISISPGRNLQMSFYLETAAPVPFGNRIDLGASIDPADAYNGEFFQASISSHSSDPDSSATVARYYATRTGDGWTPTVNTVPDPGYSYDVGVLAMGVDADAAPAGATNADITIVRARFAALVI